jgi:Nuclease-related domain
MGFPLYSFIPFLIIAAVILMAIIAVELFRYQIARKGLRSPFTQKLERFPGQSLLKRLDELNEEVSIQAAALLSVPIAIYAGYISNLYFGNRPFNRTEATIVAALAIVFLGYMLFKLRGFIKERRNIRLGYEGELTVGQTLNRLMLDGYRVFHDFPAEKFNIDHIVVGEKGVFAIETKTRSKRTSTNRQQDATVEYDGRALHFPKGTDIDMIAQAKRQSKWLSNWLSQAVGEDISVRAIVALPGWFVKRTSSEGIPIVNPKQFESLFEHIQARPLTTEMITRITHQLDQKCRDIEPQA